MSKTNLTFNKYQDKNKLLLKTYQDLVKKIHQGGGTKSAAKQHKKGKLLARERIDYLKDDDADFLEIGTFVGHDMF